MATSQESALERTARTQDAARARITEEIVKSTNRIAELEQSIQKRQVDIENLVKINQQNREEEQMDQVAVRTESGDKQPRNIAPEDALDTIIRLENAIKLASRRNQMIERELAVQHRMLKEKTRDLDAARKAHEELVSITGFTSTTKPAENVTKRREDIEEMERLEATLTEEAKTAKVIIRKKQQLIETLQREVDAKKLTEENLYATYNDVRVKDRDVQQAEGELEELKREDRKRNNALALAEDRRDVVALSCLEKDKDFLKREVQKARDQQKHCEMIQKKQINRHCQLQARHEMIVAAIKDMNWEQEFESAVNTSALVLAEAQGAADDEERIFPPNEKVAAEVYALLQTNFDALEKSRERKDILLLEKAAVVRAMEDKVQKATLKHNLEAKQQQVEDRHRLDDMQLRQGELQEKLASYRMQIEALTRKNLKLRGQIEKETARP